MNVEKLIAERMHLIDSSGIRKVFDLAQSLENPVNLSIGQPDFDVPEPVKARAIEAIREGRNKYTVTQGIAELRQALLDLEKERSGIADGEILITSGVSGGLLLAFMALVNPGDRVIVPDPYFVMYKHLCRLAGGEPVFVDTYPDFQLTVERLEAADTKGAKVLLLNSPCNPTGEVSDAESLRRIVEWAERRGIFLISDEIYRDFVYDADYTSTARFTGNLLLLNGFSKSAAMTGWRLGYAVGPKPVIAEMTKLQQFSFVCAPSFAQYAALASLDVDWTPYMAAYRKKRDLAYEGLRDRFELRRPRGAFYAFVRAPDGDGDAFVKKAIANNVLIIPGSVFSEKKSHFRLSFAADDGAIEAGAKILSSLA